MCPMQSNTKENACWPTVALHMATTVTSSGCAFGFCLFVGKVKPDVVMTSRHLCPFRGRLARGLRAGVSCSQVEYQVGGRP